MAIVPEELSSQLLSALTDLGYRTTLISTTGALCGAGTPSSSLGSSHSGWLVW